MHASRMAWSDKVSPQAWLHCHVCNTMGTTDLTQHLLCEVSRCRGRFSIIIERRNHSGMPTCSRKFVAE